MTAVAPAHLSFPPPPFRTGTHHRPPPPATLRRHRRRFLRRHALSSYCLPLASAAETHRAEDAAPLFMPAATESRPPSDVGSYASTISSWAKSGKESSAVRLFVRMLQSGVEPNGFALVAVLTACIRLAHYQLGLQIHALAVRTRYVESVYVANAVMAVYVKCGRIADAVNVFDTMLERDVASYNTVISGLVQEFQYDEAFELFRSMVMEGMRVDHFTISSLVTAAAELVWRVTGKEVHAHALKIGYGMNLSVNNALIRFYAKCGKVEEVVGLFERMVARDVISWTEMVDAYMEFGLVQSAVDVFNDMPERNCVSYNALLTGFCRNRNGQQALELFRSMVDDGVELSDSTLTSVLTACGLVSDVRTSEQLHAFVIKVGFRFNSLIESALLDMCTRCGRMDDAKKMFDRWVDEQSRSIAWTSLVCGYAQNGQPEKALTLVCRESEMTRDEVAFATILGLCAALGFAKKGEQIHAHAIKSGFFCDLGVGNAAVSMYAKCGNLEGAEKVFHLMAKHDTVSWNALISGHLFHRKGEKALSVWDRMKNVMAKPNGITFILIISACRHLKSSDAIDTCHGLFSSMRSRYGIEPASEHYASMIHVLGHWNKFEEAEDLINNMPFKPDAAVWRALLDSCRLRSNSSLGKKAAHHLLAMEPHDTSTFILLSNLYSASGRWHCSEEVRKEMRSKGLQKYPARSWIIHDNHIHSFYARDRSHLQTKDIYSALEILILECLKAGYEPDTSFVLQEAEECQKKDFLMYHSIKLAVTYGLLVAGPGRPVRVMKNIHVCGDCHNFIKYVSITTRREISIRDSTGFHCFNAGKCSCEDYW